MAESISIPLTHIQSMLDEIAPSLIHCRLQELESILIQIQQSEDRRLLQDLSIDECKKLDTITNDIRQFAYQIDDHLDKIYINVESCRRWINSNIPNFSKTLGIAYHKSKFLYNNRLLINLVKKGKYVESQNYDIKEGNEEQRMNELHIFSLVSTMTPTVFSMILRKEFQSSIVILMILLLLSLTRTVIKQLLKLIYQCAMCMSKAFMTIFLFGNISICCLDFFDKILKKNNCIS